MTVIYDQPGLPVEWPDVAAVILVGRERAVNGKRTDSAHYYITNLKGTAADLGRLIRRHWAVENELHWCLDVAFRKDTNETAAGHAGANLGQVRRAAASLFKQDPSKGAVKANRFKAALDEDYLLQVLQGFIQD